MKEIGKLNYRLSKNNVFWYYLFVILELSRLFELGFADQLKETLHRLPPKRQTLIFSATLPGALLEFAQAGLTEPALIRLDVETKLSNNLKTAFITCLPFEKEALLFHILNTIIPPDEKVVIFFATKHHVDYMELVISLLFYLLYELFFLNEFVLLNPSL